MHILSYNCVFLFEYESKYLEAVLLLSNSTVFFVSSFRKQCICCIHDYLHCYIYKIDLNISQLNTRMQRYNMMLYLKSHEVSL